ncbi:DUF488 domain-containing protein [Sporosarcina sp. FSL K6-1522]|uniref:DUF488 domain-containing protein n=1 Tax=Sporosarcina sp. FSL K6-1522 TaxID=2921554 RepID=UPI00315B1965
MEQITLKRIYEPYNPNDGYRVLIDRLWPRGVTKARAQLDDWAKDVAPSSELRKWFAHDPKKFTAFEERYLDELHNDKVKRQKFEELYTLAQTTKITLLFAAKDPIHNHAILLKAQLERISE